MITIEQSRLSCSLVVIKFSKFKNNVVSKAIFRILTRTTKVTSTRPFALREFGDLSLKMVRRAVPCRSLAQNSPLCGVFENLLQGKEIFSIFDLSNLAKNLKNRPPFLVEVLKTPEIPCRV